MAVINPNPIDKLNMEEEQKKNEEKRQKAKNKEKAEEKKAITKARLKNGVTFVRKDTRPGIYSTNGIGKRLQIRDRGHYFTKKDSEIKFLDSDSEIVELAPEAPKKDK
ncbi:hypothetical protein KAJ61_05825 [Candidatus Parcubacteria bacterium]|nr:hypothetical protein [Candidatus Parcubacteria bacterium]